MNDAITPVRARWLAWAGSACLVAIALWGGATLQACGGPQANVPEARPLGAAYQAPDAGLPPPATSSRRGVIVPSDTGIGSMPSGSAPSTGTAGRATSPLIGNPGGGGN